MTLIAPSQTARRVKIQTGSPQYPTIPHPVTIRIAAKNCQGINEKFFFWNRHLADAWRLPYWSENNEEKSQCHQIAKSYS